MGGVEVKAYLEYLVMRRNVAASTQNQALNALVFLYEQVLQQPIGELGEFLRAKKPKRLPTVLTREEVERLLAHLQGVPKIMAGIAKQVTCHTLRHSFATHLLEAEE